MIYRVFNICRWIIFLRISYVLFDWTRIIIQFKNFIRKNETVFDCILLYILTWPSYILIYVGKTDEKLLQIILLSSIVVLIIFDIAPKLDDNNKRLLLKLNIRSNIFITIHTNSFSYQTTDLILLLLFYVAQRFILTVY